jgi:hypothetical protein
MFYRPYRALFEEIEIKVLALPLQRFSTYAMLEFHSDERNLPDSHTTRAT